jgi:hypothetical protein
MAEGSDIFDAASAVGVDKNRGQHRGMKSEPFYLDMLRSVSRRNDEETPRRLVQIFI